MELNVEVLIVDDDPGLRMALQDRFKHWGCQVSMAADGSEALALCARQSFDLVLLDLSMPGMNGMEVLKRLLADGFSGDIVVLTAHGSVNLAVEALKAGASDFLSKPADFELLAQVTTRALSRRKLQLSRDALANQSMTKVIVGAPIMKQLLDVAARAAASDSTIVLTGESGSGKQVISEFIHEASLRRDGPFVYVNCVAISEDLIESTLFGHERGAFTGAIARKPGRLEGAVGGTAFLDEIGDISPGLQTKLLHFLETGEFERVGGNQTVHVDCRIVAATNKDLAKEVEAGRFREDLYYRLNVINLRVPPLRERPEDVRLLSLHYLQHFAQQMKRSAPELAPETISIMEKYNWPGNVRQLKNVIERMVVLSSEKTLKPGLLPQEIRTPGLTVSGKLISSDDKSVKDLDFREAVANFKRSLLTRALNDCSGNQTRAADQLGLQRSYLNRLLKDLGLRND